MKYFHVTYAGHSGVVSAGYYRSEAKASAEVEELRLKGKRGIDTAEVIADTTAFVDLFPRQEQ